MKANQHTAEQIIRILAQAEQGTQTVGEVCREHGIAETTFAQRAPGWRNAYGGMPVSEVQRLKEWVPLGQRRMLASSGSSPSACSKSMLSRNCWEKKDDDCRTS